MQPKNGSLVMQNLRRKRREKRAAELLHHPDAETAGRRFRSVAREVKHRNHWPGRQLSTIAVTQRSHEST
jgi:hypothetical protein